jgi:hypothetical protein
MPGKYGVILNDFMDEALRIHKAAEQNGLPLRVMGCIAYRIKSPQFIELHKAMGRVVTDIDFMSYYKYRNKVIDLFRDDLGYQYIPPSFARATNLRDLFINPNSGGKVDVFYDMLDFCHNIDFKKHDRLSLDNPTITLGDLFLEKAQIVELNAKDLKDMVITFLANDVSEMDDDSMINGSYISSLLRDDWGFYHTVTTNIKKLLDFVPTVDLLSQAQRDQILSRAQKLLKIIDDTPKTGGWKRRAAIGTKQRWYKFVHSMEGTRDAGGQASKC